MHRWSAVCLGSLVSGVHLSHGPCVTVRTVQLPAAPEEPDADTPRGDYAGLEAIYREREQLSEDGSEGPLSDLEGDSESEDEDDSDPYPGEDEAAPVQENPPQAAPVGEEPKPPKKYTGAWYRYHQFSPITPEHDARVVDICFWLARWKSENRVTNTAMTQICELIHFILLPDDNLVPPSHHLIKCALGVPAAAASVRHVCDMCWTLFPPLRPELFKDHREQVCGTRGCQQPRFRKGTSGQIIPRRRVWYFGDEETLADLLSKDGILEAMLSHRKATWTDPAGYWASPAGQMINARCRGLMSNTDLSDEIVVPVTAGTVWPDCHYVLSTNVTQVATSLYTQMTERS